MAADIGLDTLEGADQAHSLLGDRGLARLDDLVKPAPCMGPAIGKLDLLLAVSQQAIVSGMAIDLQDAGKAFQDIPGVFSPVPGSMGKGHAGWIIPTPGRSSRASAEK